MENLIPLHLKIMLLEMRRFSRIGTLLAILIAGVDVLSQGGASPEVKTVSFEGIEVVQAFNDTASQTRLVLVFSPT